ncbi:FAA hydrolase family protein [Paenarthrobacter nitroguajacolicus]|uniref:fumarylacetoacetate hydrolase family protein n=1 Tax=Paenarthrobacter nitroguajacolicus TaxID=211146 RepID=UPI0015B9BFB2|nr:fumarylacetoacetate hydrolase family protein [Paenarthrobacter nitroguajacolicus]NWL10319.1 FAA hydrolase family protein [Paenarthrobacter nitroguajacolicus]
MKIAKIDHEGETRIAFLSLGTTGEEGFWTVAEQRNLNEVFQGGDLTADPGQTVLQDPQFLAPYAGGTIFGIGLNFRDTISEMNFPVPQTPYLFPKLSSSVTGHGEPILADPEVTTEVDWEGELAVIIGRTARNVPRENALDVVFGYTAANDVSARDVQREDPQWVRGKGLDGFCPLGPLVVTADEIPDPQNVGIRTWVNGEIVQDGNTSDMLFTVAELIEYLSRYFTLQPGDVILTGTPSGCGGFLNPPRFVSGGDTMTVEVAGIGRLSNPVDAP